MFFLFREFSIIAGILGALAVGVGAFGAHALKNILPAERLPIFETGVKYHFYHVFALVLVVILANLLSHLPAESNNTQALQYLKWAASCFIAGIILFSGSLYVLACRSVLGIEHWGFVGAITPLGGICFITGWLLMAFALFNAR